MLDLLKFAGGALLGLLLAQSFMAWVRRPLRVPQPLPECRRRQSVPTRIEDAMVAVRRHQEMIDAHQQDLLDLWGVMCYLHGYDADSCEGDLLADVVFDGKDYAKTLERIMELRK